MREVVRTRLKQNADLSTPTDYRMRHKDGHWVEVEVLSSPLFDSEGVATGFVGITRDITERKRAEESLARERNLMRTLMDHIPAYVYIKDAEGRYLINNNAHTHFLGKASQDLVVGKTVFDLFSEDMAKQYDADDRMVIRAGQPIFNREEPSVDPAGNPIWNLTTKIPLRDQQGKVYGLVGISRDITESKRQEEEAARAAREWQTTFDATNNAIWILDQDQRILRSNKTAEQLFQRPHSEFIGKHCWEIVHGTEQPVPECPVLRAKSSLRRETMDLQIGERWLEVTVDPILDQAGRYDGAVHSVSDISERKRAEAQLNEQLAELRRWHQATLGRETRILDLKREVNALLAQHGQPARYDSVEGAEHLAESES
jgi:PAS domain S-box-containing protein